jgi:phage baseplate assembly protein W
VTVATANGDPRLLTDLRLKLTHHELRPVYEVESEQVRVQTPRGPVMVDDLAVVSGRENLGQAILIRLLTPRGELASLAHPDFGSRLTDLVGRQNTETTRHLIKLYILEALAAEARVTKVEEVTVVPAPGTEGRDQVRVTVRVHAVGSTQPVVVGPFRLELGP